MDRTGVSVIIPTYKPDRRLRQLLIRLKKQTVVPDEILVINTEEALLDRTLLEGIKGIRLVHIRKEQFDHGATRNMGADLTQGSIMVFMTMDALPADRRLIEQLTAAFADPSVACAYARQLPAKGCDPIEYYSRIHNYGPEDQYKTKADLERLGIKTYFCSNVCAAYRRDRFQEVGGFPDHTIFNEDMIYAAHAISAGYAVTYRAQARVFHSHSYTGVQQFKRNFDLGVSQAQFPEVFGDIKSESEGVRLVAGQARQLTRSAHILQLPRLFWISGCKYLGYRAGKAYRRLPQQLVRRMTSNPAYWTDEPLAEDTHSHAGKHQTEQ